MRKGSTSFSLVSPLDDPDAKDLADIEQRVSVAVLFLQLGNFLRVADAAGTMRSTREPQKVQSSLTYFLKPSSRPHCSMYWLTHFSSSLPLLSINSQASMMMPFLPAL